MRSRTLGHVALDPDALRTEVDTILAAPAPEQAYSEYRFGTFLTYILRNPSGSATDGVFRGLDGPVARTALGQQLGYLDALVERTFDTRRLRMLRVYLLQDALLIPHRDYVEFPAEAARMARLHVPLVTNPRALHSEADTVFHMRAGEIWYLDVMQVHAACNAAPEPRLSLVLDFELDGAPLESALRPGVGAAPPPLVVARPPLEDGFDQGVRALGRLVAPDSFRDIVQLLSRVHFHRDAPAGRFFDWLDTACSGHPELTLKAAQLRTFLIDQRRFGERFAL
jgi:hypothetical protein